MKAEMVFLLIFRNEKNKSSRRLDRCYFFTKRTQSIFIIYLLMTADEL